MLKFHRLAFFGILLGFITQGAFADDLLGEINEDNINTYLQLNINFGYLPQHERKNDIISYKITREFDSDYYTLGNLIAAKGMLADRIYHPSTEIILKNEIIAYSANAYDNLKIKLTIKDETLDEVLYEGTIERNNESTLVQKEFSIENISPHYKLTFDSKRTTFWRGGAHLTSINGLESVTMNFYYK